MLRLLHSLWRAFKMNRAMRAESPDDRCVACDSRNVTIVGPQAYRCGDCGHEGGDGWAAHARREREAGFQQMPPAERRASARVDLLEARTLLTSGIGDLQRATRFSQFDMVGLSPMSHGEADGEGHEKHHALTAGVGLLLEARQRARDAQAKLGVPLGAAASAEGGGISNQLAAFDLHLDSVIVDRIIHHDIQRTLSEARDMLLAVEVVLEREFGG